MANLEVDPGLQLQIYGEKLAGAQKENVLLQAAVSQLQNLLAQAQSDNEKLKAENDRLSEGNASKKVMPAKQ